MESNKSDYSFLFFDSNFTYVFRSITTFDSTFKIIKEEKNQPSEENDKSTWCINDLKNRAHYFLFFSLSLEKRMKFIRLLDISFTVN